MWNNKTFFLRVFSSLVAVESLAAFCFLALIPADSKNAIFLGLSSLRYILLGFIIVFFLSGILIFIIARQMISWVDMVLSVAIKRTGLVLFALVIFTVGVLFFLTPAQEIGEAFYQRLLPLVGLLTLVAFQILLGQFLWTKEKLNRAAITVHMSKLQVSLVVLVLLAIISTWMVFSGVGLIPEKYGWQSPGTPILASQIFFASLIGLLFAVFWGIVKKWHGKVFNKSPHFFSLEFVVCVALWLTAVLVWWGEPMRKESYFTPSPAPPNFEYYPYSDSSFYDQTAQRILIGEGENNKVILRPLYVFFLALAHVVKGQKYQDVIFFQILFLAVPPALLFPLVSRLGNIPAGVISAVLIIFREKNAIALTDVIEVSHSKLLLSDLPTMALMLLTVYCFIKWLEKADNPDYFGIMAGASFGLMVLIRSQAQLLIPIFLIWIVFVGGFHIRRSLKRSLLLILGFSLVVAPWIWRNVRVSERAVIENTEFYIRLFASGYLEPDETAEILPDESFDEYQSRVNSQILSYVLNHPLEIARVYASYFLHNEISSVIYLPMSPRLYDLRSYITKMQFWDTPYIPITFESGSMLFFSLALMALGLGTAIHRVRFLGIFPLFVHLIYSFSVVPARLSGWRFILPVDWIPQIYYCIGLVQLSFIITSLFWDKFAPAVMDERTAGRNAITESRKVWIVAIAFLALGFSLPLLEIFVPARYPVLSQVELVRKFVPVELFLDSGDVISASALGNFLKTESGATVLYGRALYPSYYEKGEFWGEHSRNLLEASEYDRLQFNLMGSTSAFVFIPLQGAPQYFPHASDVFVIGCLQDASVRALIVKVDNQIFNSSQWHGLTCSVSE